MLKYDFADEGHVEVEGVDQFYVQINDEAAMRLTRAELREMRSAIEDALNTSEDEFGDVDF